MHLEVTARRGAQPDLDRDAVLQVFDCRFVAEAANVVFVGGVGTGKTLLSIALGMACCQHDYRVRFVTAAEKLVTMLVEAQLARYERRPRRRAGLPSRSTRPVPIDVHQRSAVRALVRGLDPTAAAAVIDRRRSPSVEAPGCRAHQHDRVLAGVKSVRPAMRGRSEATCLDAGGAHGPRRACPIAHNASDREGPESDVLTERLGGSLHVATGVQLPFPAWSSVSRHARCRKSTSARCRRVAAISRP